MRAPRRGRGARSRARRSPYRSEEHTSELQSRSDLVCRLLLEKKKQTNVPTGRGLLRGSHERHVSVDACRTDASCVAQGVTLSDTTSRGGASTPEADTLG